MKINKESSPQEIWMGIRFLEINGSPSLINIKINRIDIKINSIDIKINRIDINIDR